MTSQTTHQQPITFAISTAAAMPEVSSDSTLGTPRVVTTLAEECWVTASIKVQ